MDEKMVGFYLEIELYEMGELFVGDGYWVYWEVSGNLEGKFVVFLYGGFGSGIVFW